MSAEEDPSVAAVPAEGGAAAETDPAVTAARSALEANIKSKGKNSYYYAHANNLGQGGDKKNYGTPPRLLSRQLGRGAHGAPLRLITDCAWADSGKKVKVYIALPAWWSFPPRTRMPSRWPHQMSFS